MSQPTSGAQTPATGAGDSLTPPAIMAAVNAHLMEKFQALEIEFRRRLDEAGETFQNLGQASEQRVIGNVQGMMERVLREQRAEGGSEPRTGGGLLNNRVKPPKPPTYDGGAGSEVGPWIF